MGTPIFSSASFYFIRIDTHQLVPPAHRHGIIPQRMDSLMKLLHFHIAEFDMDDTRRRCMQHHFVRKVSVFGDNGQIVYFGIRPNLTVFHAGVDIDDMLKCFTLP